MTAVLREAQTVWLTLVLAAVAIGVGSVMVRLLHPCLSPLWHRMCVVMFDCTLGDEAVG
jgi:hypothetical protein